MKNRIEIRPILSRQVLRLLACAVVAGCGAAPSQPKQSPVEPTRSGGLGTPSTGYDFAYDPAGRLSVVTTPTGEGARYVYDPAGNILAIERYTAGTLTVLGFSPLQGDPGQTVTVSGVGFSTVASENAVLLNGTAVTVTSCTSAQLTFVVPAGASTGRIVVTVVGSTATSPSDFIVTNSGVSISSFTPTIGKAGDSVSISGQGFDLTPLNDSVVIGHAQAQVTTATATSLQVTVPAMATTGKVSVQTPAGSAMSSSNFVVVPSSYAATNVVSSATAAIGSTTPVTIATAGKLGLVAFEGAIGQALSLYASAVTLAGTTTIEVWTPKNLLWVSGTVANGSTAKLDLSTLPMNGTYTIMVKPAATSTGSISLQVLADAFGTVQVDGASASMSLVAGQNGRFAFTGNAGDLLGLGATQLGLTPTGGNALFAILNPDGSTLTWCTLASASSCQLAALPTSRGYTMRIIPSGTAAASITLLLSRPLTGTVTADGALTRFQSTRAGQTGRYTFTATAGQSFSLRVTETGPWPNLLYVYVWRPDNGQTVASDWYQSASFDEKFDLANLPATGTYLIQVKPAGTDVGTVDLHLWTDVAADVTVDGTAVAMALAAGQNGRYTFTGTAGDLVGLGVTQRSLTPTGGDVVFTVLKPDGFSQATCWMSSASSCQVAALPVTGAYAIRVVGPVAAAAAVTVLLSRPLTGALASDGTPTHFQTTRAGQMGRYSFSATALQSFSLRATVSGAWPSTLWVNIFRPDGQGVGSDWYQNPYDEKFDLSNLPQTGTYVVRVKPQGVDVGTVDLQFWAESTASLQIGGAAAAITLGTGQNGRYTFVGAVGDLLSLVVTQLSVTAMGANVAFTVLKPDLSLLTTCTMTAPSTCLIASLPGAGTYSVRVVPSGTSGAGVTAQIARR